MKVSDRAITIIVAFVCLLPGYYFYRQSIQVRVPSFLVDPARALIIDSSGTNLSDLAVLYKGKSVGERNVSAIRLYFWNDGKMPIRRNDVLKPLQCVLPTGTEILDSRILKISRDVTAFRILPGSASPNTAVMMDFDILEKGDGAAIQIIYAGPKDAPLHFDGIVVGAPLPIVKGVRTPSGLERRLGTRQRFGVFVMLVGVAIGLLALVGRRGLQRGLQILSKDSKAVLFFRIGNSFTRISFAVLPFLYIGLGAFMVFYNPPTLREVPPAIVSDK